MNVLTRRQMLARTTKAVFALGALSPLAPLLAEAKSRRFKIGACDWSMGHAASIKAFELAREIGLDGVQVSLGVTGDEMKLGTPETQRLFKQAQRDSGVEIASMAIGELNKVPYKSDPHAETWVESCVDVLKALDAKVVLLAFFGKGDIAGDKEGTDEVVRRLKKVAPKAEKAGVVLGLESWLSAEDTLRIMDRVGSTAVKMYYDVRNSTERGYDICKEIRWLGSKNICEFHMKENGALLGQGKVDFERVRDALNDIGYSGWMHIEAANPRGAEIRESYIANRKFLQRIFQSNP